MDIVFLAEHFMERMAGMKKKSYKGFRCEKRSMSKYTDGVARVYNVIECLSEKMGQFDEWFVGSVW